MSEIGINGILPTGGMDTAKKTISEATKLADSARPQITELPNVSLGRDLVSQPIVLKANEPYLGKSFDVQALGSSPIKVQEVTAENVGELSKSIDIWYQGGAEAAEKAIAEGKPDPRFLHPKVGESMQHYGLEPIGGDYVTHDLQIIDYARKNGLTAFDEQGRECFLNRYNGDKAIIESTYTTKDGKFLSEIGGLKGTMAATQVKDMKVALLPPGSKVVPLEASNPKIVGVGDVVCCAVKKGKPKNDWFVKPVTEFLKTAKANAEKGNTELIEALTKFVEKGGKDAGEWAKILRRFAR